MIINVELAIAFAQNIRIVTMEMDGVGQTRSTNRLLDDPVGPGSTIRNIDQVVVLGVVALALSHVLECGLSRINDHARSVDSPEHNRLVVGGDGAVVESNGQMLRLDGERFLGDVLRDLWHCLRIFACSRLTTESRRVRICDSYTIVREDSSTNSGVKAHTRCMGLCTEPVVAGCLVGGEYDIVALSDANENPVCIVRYDRHEVVSNDSEGMTIKRNANRSVDGWVYKAKTVFLATLDLHFVVLSSSH